jgi:SNF2 family DNA or RNA helicase
VSRPFKHFGALKNGNGFGIAVDDIDPLEAAQINDSLRALKANIQGVKYHPNYYPRNGKMINAWVLPAEHEVIDPMLDIVDRFGFKRTQSAERLIQTVIDSVEKQKEEHAANRAASEAHDGPPVYVPGLDGELRNYQRAAVDWILRNRRVYIGDEMGTGKTLCSLAAVIADGSLPLVVVCPASVKMGWQRQIKKFFPDMPDEHIYLCSGRVTKAIPSDVKIIVINYDILSSWLTRIQHHRYRAVILDEAHFIKSRKAKRTRAAVVLAQGADMRIAMSGTPVTSRPIELVSQLEAIGRMSDMTEGRKAWWFIERYCRPFNNGYGWDTSGSSNLFELNDRLRKTGILIRRRKDDVLADLPPKERVSIPLDISNRDEYIKVRNSIAYWVRQQIETDPEYLEAIKFLPVHERQLVFERVMREKVARAQSAATITKLSALRQVCMRGKMDAACSWLDDFLTSEEKIVVFCIHREAVNILAERFGDQAVKVIGGMSADARQKAIDTFVNDDNVRIVVANIDAAAEGIDGWQHVCSNVAFLELTWTPSKHHQAEDRCHRSGQQNPVTCYYLLANQTIDEYLATLIDNKRAVISAIVDGERVERDDNILVDLVRRLTEGEF